MKKQLIKIIGLAAILAAGVIHADVIINYPQPDLTHDQTGIWVYSNTVSSAAVTALNGQDTSQALTELATVAPTNAPAVYLKVTLLAVTGQTAAGSAVLDSSSGLPVEWQVVLLSRLGRTNDYLNLCQQTIANPPATLQPSELNNIGVMYMDYLTKTGTPEQQVSDIATNILTNLTHYVGTPAVYGYLKPRYYADNGAAAYKALLTTILANTDAVSANADYLGRVKSDLLKVQ